MSTKLKHCPDILTNKFQEDFTKPCLANSTEWKSLVHYPGYLKDKALFTLVPSDTHKVSKTFLDKIISSVGSGSFDTTQSITLTDEVKEALSGRKSDKEEKGDGENRPAESE